MYEPLKPGIEYKDGKLSFNKEKEEVDRNVPEDKRTLNVIKDIANSIDSMITMTVDIPSNYDEMKVPMLDVKAWMEDESNQIYY